MQNKPAFDGTPLSLLMTLHVNYSQLVTYHFTLGRKFRLRKKCSYSELFWSVFSRIWTEYGDILRLSPYSVPMWEIADQNNSKYGHFLRSTKSVS